MKIWCLFSIENQYYQPNNNLVAWWTKKPTTDKLFPVIGQGLSLEDTNLLFAGNKVRVCETDYRLEEVEEDTNLSQ